MLIYGYYLLDFIKPHVSKYLFMPVQLPKGQPSIMDQLNLISCILLLEHCQALRNSIGFKRLD